MTCYHLGVPELGKAFRKSAYARYANETSKSVVTQFPFYSSINSYFSLSLPEKMLVAFFFLSVFNIYSSLAWHLFQQKKVACLQ